MSQALQGALFTYGKGGTIETIFGTAILKLQAGDKVSSSQFFQKNLQNICQILIQLQGQPLGIEIM